MTELILIWDGEDAGEQAGPDVGDIQRRISGLNGAGRTLVMLERDGATFAVGGSQRGVIAYLEDTDGEFWQVLSTGSTSDEVVEVVAGGQPGEYPSRVVTSPDAAMIAASEFARSGGRSDQVGWEQG